MPESVNGKFWVDLGGVTEEFSAANMNRLRPGGMAYKSPLTAALQLSVSPKIWAPGGVVKEFPGNVIALAASDTHYVYLDPAESGALQLKSQTGGFPSGSFFYVAVVETGATQIATIKNVLIDTASVAGASGTEQRVIEQMSTGRVEFAGLTRLGGLDVQIGSGRGYVKSGPPAQAAPATLQSVSWSATTVSLPDNAASHLFVSAAGTPQSSTSFPDPEQNIIVGSARTHNGSVVFLSFYDIDVIQKVSDTFRYLRDIVGPALSSGVLSSIHNPPSLQIAVSSGVFYIAQDRKATGAIAGPASFTYWHRNGSGGWTAIPSQTALDDQNYDNGSGSLVAIPSGKWKNDLILVAPINDAGSAEVHVIYSQQVFDSQPQANALASPTPPSEFSSFSVRSGLATIQQGGAQIAEIHDIRPRLGSMSPSGTPVTDHGFLGGLDDDDHPQYQTRSEKGVPNGYAPLDSSSLVPNTHIPPPQAYHDGKDPTDTFSTPSSSYVNINLGVSPAPGTYLFVVSGTVEPSVNNLSMFIGVGLSTSPGTVQAQSEREIQWNQIRRRTAVTSGRIVVSAGQNVQVRARVTGGGTITFYARSITLVRIVI